MNLITDQGLVLRRTRHQENDLRLTLLLREHGKVSVVVKGGQKIQSKLRALQEPFTEADYQIYLPEHGIYGRVIGGILVSTHHLLRMNVHSFGYASKSCEMVDVLIPYRVPTPDVYDILRSTFLSLETTPMQSLFWMLFVVRLFKHLGHGDFSPDILKVVGHDDRLALESILIDLERNQIPTDMAVSDESVRRCLGMVESHLERVLPWRLKSEVPV